MPYADEVNLQRIADDIKTNIVNNLTTNSSTKFLSAAMGKSLNDNKADKTMYSVSTVKITGTIAASSYDSLSVSAKKTGYTPIGILGCHGAGTGYGFVNNTSLYLDGNGDVIFSGRNLGTSAATMNHTVYVLYKKN